MILELRTYRVQPGRLDDFLDAMLATVPHLRRHGIDVVAVAASLDSGEGDHAVLMRAFATVEARDEQEGNFYSSQLWLTELRSRIMALLVEYHTVVLEVPLTTVEGLRAAGTRLKRDHEQDGG